MILFKPEMAQAILEGRKTVTRRVGKKRWNVGAIRLCYTRPAFARPNPGKPFARIEVLSVTQEAFPGAAAPNWERAKTREDLRVVLAFEAAREGFGVQGWGEFARAFRHMHGAAALDEPCYRVEFRLVEVLAPEVEAQVREGMAHG